MKICYLNNSLNSSTGAGRFLTSLLDALKRELPKFECQVLTHDDFLPKTKIKMLFALPKIRAVFKKSEIIHALDGWPYGVIAAIASWGLKKRIVITAIGTGAIQPLYSFWKKPLLEWAYRRADKLFAVSSNTKKEILRVIPDLKIEVINHGVDYAKYQATSTKQQVIEKLRPYILSVGAWKPRKGFEYSLKAFEEIKNRFPNLNYVIVSKAPENVKKKYDRVIFLEDLPEEKMMALYKNAELFTLLPQDVNKDIEGFGLVFLEAAAAGLPVVATENSSAEEIVLNGKIGFLAPQKDFKKAAAVIEGILSRPSLRNQFSKEAIKFARTMSWKKVAQQYSRFYLNLY